MIRKTLFSICWLFAIGFTSTAFAVTMSTLYQAEVPVASHSAADWKKALAPALSQVLVKVSGNPNVAQNPALRAALSKAEKYVQSYNYAPATNGKGLSVQVRFSPKNINDLLQQASQPILSKNRALTIVWLAMQNANNAQAVALSDKHPIVIALKNEADKTGLPLIAPTLDLQDMSTINANQVLNLDQQAVTSASNRYQPEAILIGKILPAGNNRWQGQWVLLNNGGGNQTWQTQGNNPTATAVATLQQLRPNVTSTSTPNINNTDNAVPGASTPAPSAGPSVDVTLKVSGINGLDDYTALVDYLRSLDVVSKLNVLQTQGDQLFIRLKVTAAKLTDAKDILIKEINAGNQLAPNPDSSGQYIQESLTVPPIIMYRWLGNPMPDKQQGNRQTNMRRQSYAAPPVASPASPSSASRTGSSLPPVVDYSVPAQNGLPAQGGVGMAEAIPMDNANDQYMPQRDDVPAEVSP